MDCCSERLAGAVISQLTTNEGVIASYDAGDTSGVRTIYFQVPRQPSDTTRSLKLNIPGDQKILSVAEGMLTYNDLQICVFEIVLY